MQFVVEHAFATIPNGCSMSRPTLPSPEQMFGFELLFD